MAGGGNGLGDAFQRVAQRAQMQVAGDPAELLASLDHARGAPAAHGGQEHTVLNGPGAASSWLSVYRQLRKHRPICPALGAAALPRVVSVRALGARAQWHREQR